VGLRPPARIPHRAAVLRRRHDPAARSPRGDLGEPDRAGDEGRPGADEARRQETGDPIGEADLADRLAAATIGLWAFALLPEFLTALLFFAAATILRLAGRPATLSARPTLRIAVPITKPLSTSQKAEDEKPEPPTR
jgi:hypothetical protein